MNLANGKNANGTETNAPFQAMNYVSFTATPYANVLNEAFEESLYFARNANQADTLMQMGRWFGYRKGYELLQRIWMPVALQEKFEMLEKIDEKLKEELQDYMDKGKSPAQFGPHIVNSATIKRFMITAKNRRQNAVEDDFDFSGDSYETTKFDEKPETLQETAA